jgi:hypothetical protein
MAAPISAMALPTPDAITNDTGFRLMLETHKAYFRQQGNFQIHSVDLHDAFKWRYDLYGYLSSKSIHPELHFLTMRLNEMENPTEFDNINWPVLYIPDIKLYGQLKGKYVTSLGKVGK